MHKFKYIYPDKIKFYGGGDLATAGCLPNAPQKVMIEKKDFPGGADMEIQDMIKNLREKHNLTQEQIPSPDHLEQDVRCAQFDSWLSQLKHWK